MTLWNILRTIWKLSAGKYSCAVNGFSLKTLLSSVRIWGIWIFFFRTRSESSLLQNGTGGPHNQKALSVRHANSVSLEQGCCDPARSTAIEWKQNPAWNVGLDRCLSSLSDHITEPTCTRQRDAHSITLQSHFSLPTNMGQIRPSASQSWHDKAINRVQPRLVEMAGLQAREPANMLMWQHGLVVLFSTAELSVVNDVNI